MTFVTELRQYMYGLRPDTQDRIVMYNEGGQIYITRELDGEVGDSYWVFEFSGMRGLYFLVYDLLGSECELEFLDQNSHLIGKIFNGNFKFIEAIIDGKDVIG